MQLSDPAARIEAEITGPPRNPQRLYDAWVNGEIPEPTTDLPHLISSAWTRADNDSPESSLEQHKWLALYRAAGFFTLTTNAPPLPCGDLTIYRAAPAGQVMRLAWTLDLQTAEYFKVGKERRRIAGVRVYRARLPQGGALAWLGNRNEREVIVDPSTLRDVQPI